MIKVERVSKQDISKDGFVLSGKYNKKVMFLGFKIWEGNQNTTSNIKDDEDKSKSEKNVGFGAKK